jgi:hypothetical protein
MGKIEFYVLPALKCIGSTNHGTDLMNNFPPSLNRIVSKYDRDGNPRPEQDIQADIKYRADRKQRRKKNGYSKDSHWSVRRMFGEKEIEGFCSTLGLLLGADQAIAIVNGMRTNSRIAASQVLRRARAKQALHDAVGPGRPRTPPQRLAAMMVSVEAYVGAGLRRDEALRRAADKWGNTEGRFLDIYKKEAKLPQDGGSDLFRAFFHKTKIDWIDNFIRDFRSSESVA